jgi:hypothetical protein
MSNQIIQYVCVRAAETCIALLLFEQNTQKGNERVLIHFVFDVLNNNNGMLVQRHTSANSNVQFYDISCEFS